MIKENLDMLLTLLEVVNGVTTLGVGVGHDSNFVVIAEYRQPPVLKEPAQLEIPTLSFPGKEVPHPGIGQVLLKLCAGRRWWCLRMKVRVTEQILHRQVP